MQIHRAIYNALKGDIDAYLQTRLYYHVYICDHHFSVAYGRPPMTRDCDSIRAASKLLALPHATQDDARLISQVNIWTISSKVFDCFGTDIASPLDLQLLPQLRRLSIALNTWRADWNEAFHFNEYVGNYPQKGVGLHFHFAKLYLCSHSFRGPTEQSISSKTANPEMIEIMTMAVNCAISIVRTVINDQEIQSHLNGLPLYFDTMIAFAAVFLLKIVSNFAATLRLDAHDILSLVEELSSVLRTSTGEMHQRHLLVDIANSLHGAIDKVRQSLRERPSPHETASFQGGQQNAFSSQGGIDLMNDTSWLENTSDGLFFENFDFLSSTNTMSGFESQGALNGF